MKNQILLNFFLKISYTIFMKTIVLTGGGTGGHVIPNISLIPLLKKHFDRICYIGGAGIEKDLISHEKDVEYFEIPTHKFVRKSIFKNILLPFKVFLTSLKCKKILKEISADVVFSKGGYVSFPVCLGAKFVKIPVVGHESDLTLGMANKFIAKLSQAFCTTFPQTSKSLKNGVFTGSPIREQLFLGDKGKGKEICSLMDTSKPYVLITGGSTGAKDLNEVVFKSVPILCKKYNVIHLVGKNKLNTKISHKNYYQAEFCYNIEHLFALSDIVVSRSGSGAICELLALKKPMILVPLPKGNSRGDQVENAEYFKSQNFATVIPQRALTTQSLCSEIEKTLKNRQTIVSAMDSTTATTLTHGTQNIVTEILKITAKKYEK